MNPAPLLAALAVLFALDALSTVYAIERQRARELNPVMAWLMELLGVRGALLIVKAGSLALVVWFAGEMGRWLYALAAVYACVVASNLYQIYRARARAP